MRLVAPIFITVTLMVAMASGYDFFFLVGTATIF
jgi:hypothetical protein